MKTDTVVDPGAMVVHLEGAVVADGAVVAPVRLDGQALLAVAHRGLHAPLPHRAVPLAGELVQDTLPLLLRVRSG